MTDDDQEQQAWGACPPGELCAMAHRLQASRHRRRAVRVAQLSTLSLLLIAAGVVTGGLIMGTRGPAPLARINCRQCRAHFEAYHLHLTDQQSMDQQLAEQMRVHFAHCRKCRLAFEKRFPGVLIAAMADATGRLAGVYDWTAAAAAGLLLAVSSP